MAVDYTSSIVGRQNLGSIKRIGRVNSRTISLAMFPTKCSATWACKKYAKALGYPAAELTIQTTRDAFRLQPLDPFKWTDNTLGITDMIFRVDRIEEDTIDTDIITVYAHEDIDFTTTATTGDVGSESGSVLVVPTISGLAYTAVIETPYVIAGDKITVIPLVSRTYGNEMGCTVNLSLDGTTYNEIGYVSYFNPHATLVGSYTDDTYEIDDEVGFTITFDSYATETNKINSITRAELFGGINTCILGNELMTIQTFTNVSGTTFDCIGICRGRWDTERVSHAPGEDFWFVGDNLFTQIEHAEITMGSTRYFKFIPFTKSLKASASDVEADTITLAGRAKKPYTPMNLWANDGHWNATYSGTVVLDWDARVRGEGAGVGNPDEVTDAAPTWEGLFTIEVYLDSVLVDTVTAIDALTYTYNVTDELGYDPNEIVFSLTNYIDGGGYIFRSAATTVTVLAATQYTPPTANFSADSVTGIAPATINFTNTTTGDYSYSSWDFENNGSIDSTDTDPSHEYSSAGTYSVKLTVSGLGGNDSETKTDYITIYTTASAAFSASPLEGLAPVEIFFTDESTGDYSTWAWDFQNDDVVDSTEENPSHIYNSAGTYAVKLTVSGLGGSDSETKVGYITISGSGGSVEIDVVATGDDGYVWAGFSNFYSTETKDMIGEGFGYGSFNSFFRFVNVEIPQGSTITEAYMACVAEGEGGSSGDVEARIYGNDVDDSVAPTDYSEYTSLVKTTAYADWSITESWSAETVYNTPSIISVIQEIVDRVGWVSGNDMTLLIENNGSTEYQNRGIADHSHASYAPVKLYVSYT